MLNCWVCPFHLDCKVEKENKEMSSYRFPWDSQGAKFDAVMENRNAYGRLLLTPKDEAKCPLKQAVLR